MEDNLSLQNCGNDDALSFQSGMFKVGRVREVLQKLFSSVVASTLYDSLKSNGVNIEPGWTQNGKHRLNSKWFGTGIDCEILRLGAKGWQKGKVKIRVSLEFCHNEPAAKETPSSNEPEITHPESPLDDIRRIMNENS